jgi:two-component system response regulator HydG
LKIYSKKENKQITGMANPVIEELLNYSWPGNIRELENIMARSVLMTEGAVIEKIDLPIKRSPGNGTKELFTAKSIFENERDYIVEILNNCGGRVNGPGGAAARMKIPASTLNSKMKRLGIAKGKYF